MTAAVITAIVLAAAVAAAFWWLYRRRRAAGHEPEADTPAPPGEFERMSASERIDYVFALAALDDESALPLLERALDDGNEAVAFAAARALAGLDVARLERYFADHPAARETLRAMASS